MTMDATEGLRITTWVGAPEVIPAHGTKRWKTCWEKPRSRVLRLVFRPLPSAAGTALEIPPLSKSLKLDSATIGGLPVFRGDQPPLVVMAEMPSDFVLMNIDRGKEIEVVVANEGDEDLTLDVGVEHVPLLHVVEEAQRPKNPFTGSPFSDADVGKLALGLGQAFEGMASSLSGDSRLGAAAKGFFARCFEVLEEQLSGGAAAPPEIESILPFAPISIPPGEVGNLVGSPQVGFRATRWYLEASRGQTPHGRPLCELVVEGFYVAKNFQMVGSGKISAEVLSSGFALAIDPCPPCRDVRLLLRNVGKEAVQVGGYVVGVLGHFVA